MAGLMLGSLVVGGAADRWGRRPVLLAAVLESCLAGLAGAAAPEFWSYTVTRQADTQCFHFHFVISISDHKEICFICWFLLGAGAQAMFILGFSLSIELVGSRETVPHLAWVSYKNLLSNGVHIPFALGQV